MNRPEDAPLSDGFHFEDESAQEDWQRVQATLRGDSVAFDALYEKYRERIHAILYRVVWNREDALEATQDVFVRVYRALPRYRPEQGHFFAWVYRIAMNRGIDLLRRKQVRKEQLYDQEFTLPRSDQPMAQRFLPVGEEHDRREVRHRIEAALQSLPEKHRTVFTLYSYEELTYEQIAEILEIPIGTVMSRLFYARKKLRAQLPPDWDPGGRRRREDLRQKKESS